MIASLNQCNLVGEHQVLSQGACITGTATCAKQYVLTMGFGNMHLE